MPFVSRQDYYWEHTAISERFRSGLRHCWQLKLYVFLYQQHDQPPLSAKPQTRSPLPSWDNNDDEDDDERAVL